MSDKDQAEISGRDPKIEARQWVAKTDRGLNASEIKAFNVWLAADSAHSDSYAKFSRLFKRLDTLDEWRPEHGNIPNPDLLAPSNIVRFKSWWVGASLVGAAATVLLSFALFYSKTAPSDETNLSETEVAEIGPQTLPDGSTLFPKDQAKFTVEYSETFRRVYLESGEVYFHVAKDPDRPFLVLARGVELRAVGTAFNVRLAPDSLELLVEEGRVALTPPADTPTDPLLENALAAESTENILGARQRAIVKFDNATLPPQVDSLSNTEIKRVIAWQHRKLHFQSRPMDEVLDEFNRLNDTQLILDDPNLAAIEISGTMHSKNIQGFTRLLDIGFGIKSKEISEGTILLYGLN
jgi:transmembrane sensor